MVDSKSSFLSLIYTLDTGEQTVIVPFVALSRSDGYTIGRKRADNDLSIHDISISRQHCVLSKNDSGQLFVTDLESGNGTFVNGIALIKGQLKSLNERDQLRLADVDIRIIFPPASKPDVIVEKVVRAVQDDADDESKKTIMSNVSALRSAASSPMVRNHGKNVDTRNQLIERVMTFGARRSLISFLIVLMITAASIVGIMDLKMDTSYDNMFSTKDPGYSDYKKVIDEFGSDNITLIYFQHDQLFSKERLAIVKTVTLALQNLAIVEKAESLSTSLSIRYGKSGVEIKPLIDMAEDNAVIKDNALYNPLIRQNQLSSDGTKSAIVITLKAVVGDPDFNTKAYDIIEETIKPLKDSVSHVFQVGAPRLNVEIERGMIADMTRITPLATLVLVCSIVLMLRTSLAATLPLATAGISILWTFGFMGFMGVPVNLLTAILPALVIVIGSTEDTHMLSAYLQGLEEEGDGERFPAIRFMAIHVGMPIFITSFTTTIGFLSNTVSDIALIRDFGIATSFSMVANLVATILLLPFLLRLFGPRKTTINTDYEQSSSITAYFIRFLLGLAENHQGKVIVILVVFLAVFGAASVNVTTSNDPISYFKADNQIVKDAETLHKDLAGMQVFFVTVTAQEGFDFKDPQELKKLESIHVFMQEQGAYDNITSVLDYIKLMNQEVNQADSTFYSIPDDRMMIEQYVMLFKRVGIDRFLSADAKRANFIVRHNLSDSASLNGYLADLSVEMDKVLGQVNPYVLTGKNLMINKAAESLFVSQIWSLGLLVIIICIVMSFLYSSLLAGIISIVPNMIPVIIMFGTMGFLGIPLNPGTAIVAVIAVGIAMDDTIHLLSTYNKECRVDGDQSAAAIRSIKAEAIPIISTSIALAAGFSVFFLSRFTIVTQFGELAALTMVGAMITDLLITPILLKNIRLVGIWDVVALKLGKEVLTESEIFAGMSHFQIKRAVLLSQVREYDAGDIIIKQGDEGDDLFIILTGEVDIVHFDGKRKKLIARMGWGEVFGEAGYMAGTHRLATVRVTADGEKVQVIMLNAAKVDAAMRFYPRLRSKLNNNITQILAQRLLETTNMVKY